MWILPFRSSYRRCYVKIGVRRNLAKFTGKHLCQSSFLNKVADLKKSLWHLFYRASPGYCFWSLWKITAWATVKTFVNLLTSTNTNVEILVKVLHPSSMMENLFSILHAIWVCIQSESINMPLPLTFAYVRHNYTRYLTFNYIEMINLEENHLSMYQEFIWRATFWFKFLMTIHLEYSRQKKSSKPPSTETLKYLVVRQVNLVQILTELKGTI